MPFGKFSKLVLMFGLNGNATFEQRNKKGGRISPTASKGKLSLYIKHLFLILPHRR